tara:strand:+ start:1400 stop:1627 length:228 start_codon:yes stop_codon:yes gene_type:complete
MPFSKILACAPNEECDCEMHPYDEGFNGEELFCRNCNSKYIGASSGMLMLPLDAIKLDCKTCKSEQWFERKMASQ